MSLTGMVDKRTLDKYEREAREKSRESWYLSWALDTNQEGVQKFIKITKNAEGKVYPITRRINKIFFTNSEVV